MKKHLLFFVAILFQTLALPVYAQNFGLTTNDELPDDFAAINIEVYDEPSHDGYIFLSHFGNWGYFNDAVPYLVITDNYGTPVFYRKFSAPVHDFKVQPNGQLSYFETMDNNHHLMDENFEEVHTESVMYLATDFHDFHVMENGNYLLLGDDYRLVDMDTVVEGGQPGVTVMGAIIQIQNPEREIVFNWNSWDHFQITDAMDYVDLTHPNYIDFVHANALEIDGDSAILMSCREMGEITKIDIETGDIIWRLGGKNNMFTWLGDDTIGFSMQHDIRKLADGNYQLFDNGTLHEVPLSSVLQFSVDDQNMTATVINRIRSQPEDILGAIMGNAQELPEGRIMVGWGSGSPNVTEFKAGGSKALEFSYEAMSYRAYRFPFETTAFTFDKDSLDFGEIYKEDSLSLPVEVYNNLSEPVEINRIVSHTGKFLPSEDFPVMIDTRASAMVDIKFLPGEAGTFDDLLTLCWDLNEEDGRTQRIAKQLSVKGLAVDGSSVADQENQTIRAYPNPVSETLVILFNEARNHHLEITDITGKVVMRFISDDVSCRVDMSALQPGVYFLKTSQQNKSFNAIKIIKH